MGWSIGFDSNWNRDIGYGVPAFCDHPGCGKEIDRGLSYVCGGEPYGGERGCGLFFCSEHLFLHAKLPQLCTRCHNRRPPYKPTADHPEWVQWKMTDESWGQWRLENAPLVEKWNESQANAQHAK